MSRFNKVVALSVLMAFACGCQRSVETPRATSSGADTSQPANAVPLPPSARSESGPRHSGLPLFGEAVAGFSRCELSGMYIDPVSGEAEHPFFTKNQLRPCKVTEHLAFYCLEEQFHGLPVTQLAIPSGNFPVFALYFDAKLTRAREVMKRELGSDFRPSQGSTEGSVPELVVDPDRADRSVLICTKEF